MHRAWTSSRRPGRSVGEVFVVLALLGVILAIAFPWMQRSREQSRRVRCQLNLKSISQSLQSYHLLRGFYPAGVVSDDVPVCNDRVGTDYNWISGLLDELNLTEQAALLDRSASVYADVNEAVLQTTVPVLRCPSLQVPQMNLTCYAGNASSSEEPIGRDADGVFFVDSFLDDEEVSDGLDYTVFVGEKMPLVDDLGWISGTRASLRTGGHKINENLVPGELSDCTVGGFGSAHAGGAYLLMGSGRWTFVSEDVDVMMLGQLTARTDIVDANALMRSRGRP